MDISDIKLGENYSIESFKFANTVLGNYFPDMLHKLYIVNADNKLIFFYKTVQIFLHETTRKKVRLIGKNVEDIKKELLEEMDIKTIPV